MTSSTVNTTDVPLSDAGKERAEALKDLLFNKSISNIYVTNTLRATATAKPLSEATGVAMTTYGAVDSFFLQSLRKVKRNTLVIGHSNTVDNIVNYFLTDPMLEDLPDSAYGDLFIITRKGNKVSYKKDHFGK